MTKKIVNLFNRFLKGKKGAESYLSLLHNWIQQMLRLCAARVPQALNPEAVDAGLAFTLMMCVLLTSSAGGGQIKGEKNKNVGHKVMIIYFVVPRVRSEFHVTFLS